MSRVLVCLLFTAAVLSEISYAVMPDRIAGDLATGPKVALRGNVHGLARREFDLGRADNTRLIQGVSLAFRPSAAQQKDLNRFIAELGDPKSPNYHKYLTPAQFGERFGLSLNDIHKVSTWLHGQGFSNIRVANGRNQISFDGTVGQIESAFALEMHNYGVDGVVHLANAGEPSIPAGLTGTVLGLGSLNDFAPKPRAKIQSHLTSYVSGNHFLTPADFATIYDLTPLYTANIDGTGQTIAVIGQSDISMTDVNNFRTNSSLSTPANVIKTLVPNTSASSKCGGDEGESELDIEWSGGVAKNAQILFIYAGLSMGDTCKSRNNNVWTALQYAVDNNVAPFISTSYGFCESGLGNTFVLQVQGWAKQGITQGQTIVAASGDAGAADCEPSDSTSATTGLAVDVPASIPEVTGAGGTEFTGDAQATVSGTGQNTTAASAPPYWGASNTGSDAISTALMPIPEMAWNDTSQSLASNPPGGLSASGGGASIYFTSKPPWQTGRGVANDGKRDVPDISMNSSNFHDPYLVCSEDGDASPCTDGFRNSAGGTFFAVGGTSAAAPTFSAILALVNQYLGNTPPTGLAPVNPILYQLPGNTPPPFHDVTSGDNKVKCTTGTTGCPSATTQIGFIAGTGYDQVTGLGSVDVFALAQVWKRTPTTVSVSPSSSSANLGDNITFTATVTPANATGKVNFFNNGSATPLGSGTLSTGSAIFSTTTLPLGSNSVTATYAGDASFRLSNTSSAAVVDTNTSFSLVPKSPVGTLSVAQGQTTSQVTLIVSSTQGFVNTNGSGSTTLLPVTYSCVGLPLEATCNFAGGSQTLTTSSTSVTFSVITTAPTGRLQRPLESSSKIFYAVLLPGLFGLAFTFSSRIASLGSMRMLALIGLLGISTLWTVSCGGTSGSNNKNPGTPTGSYPVKVSAIAQGAPSVTSSFQFTLSVTP